MAFGINVYSQSAQLHPTGVYTGIFGILSIIGISLVSSGQISLQVIAPSSSGNFSSPVLPFGRKLESQVRKRLKYKVPRKSTAFGHFPENSPSLSPDSKGNSKLKIWPKRSKQENGANSFEASNGHSGSGESMAPGQSTESEETDQNDEDPNQSASSSSEEIDYTYPYRGHGQGHGHHDSLINLPHVLPYRPYDPYHLAPAPTTTTTPTSSTTSPWRPTPSHHDYHDPLEDSLDPLTTKPLKGRLLLLSSAYKKYKKRKKKHKSGDFDKDPMIEKASVAQLKDILYHLKKDDPVEARPLFPSISLWSSIFRFIYCKFYFKHISCQPHDDLFDGDPFFAGF